MSEDQLAHAAAAVCYLLCTDPASLDPDGDLTAAFWPFDLEDYRPGRTTNDNIQLAQEHLAQAWLMRRVDA